MWYKVAKLGDLKDKEGIQVEAGGKLIALFFVQGEYYAIKDECTHAGAPIYNGALRGHTVVCPWHAAKFDIRNGHSVGELGYNNIRSYKVRAEGDDIEVEV